MLGTASFDKFSNSREDESMRKSVMLLTLLVACSAFAFADSFQGRLVDATCYDQHQSLTTCDPTSATTSFEILVSNKPYKLDAAGNSKAAEALKSRADRTTDPSKAPSTQVMAKITGTKDGDNTLKVDAVEIQ